MRRILGINMVISAIRNVESSGEYIMIYMQYMLIQYETKHFQNQMMLVLTPQSCRKMLNSQQE